MRQPKTLMLTFFLFVTAVGVILYLGRRSFFPTLLYADLPSASRVSSGTEVFYRGVVVGRVRDVEARTDGIRVALGIEDREAPIRIGDSVRAWPMGVEIVPGSRAAALAPHNAVLVGAPPLEEEGQRSESARAGSEADAAAGRGRSSKP